MAAFFPLRTTLRLTLLAQREFALALRPGNLAWDATAGNGLDTFALAALVGLTGRVFACDLQAEALAATARRLETLPSKASVELRQVCHTSMGMELLREFAGRLSLVVFNLGFLPNGSNPSLCTKPDTTVAAMRAATALLAGDGLLAVTAYRGHPGGQTEADAVATALLDLATPLDTLEEWQALRAPDNAPVLYLLRRQPTHCQP